MLTAPVFDLSDRIAAAIEAKITDNTLDAATVVVKSAFSAGQADLTTAGVEIRVVPSRPIIRRRDRYPTKLEHASEVIIQVLQNCPSDTAANTRTVGNFAAAIHAYFFANPEDETNDSYLDDNESEIETIFDDTAFAIGSIAMAVIRLTYRHTKDSA